MILSRSERRLIKALVATLLVALLLRAAPPAYAGARALAERVERKRVLATEVETAIAGLPALEDSAKALRAGLVSLAPRLLAGGTDADALGDLSGRLASLAAQRHGRLLHLEPLPDSADAGRLQKVRARATLESDFRGVAELLATLERQAVLLVPERIILQQVEPLPGPEAPEHLEIELELVGWYLPEANK